jgi:hypothetical protein
VWHKVTRDVLIVHSYVVHWGNTGVRILELVCAMVVSANPHHTLLYTCLGTPTKIAVTMSIEKNVQIVLYELNHAFFHVGKSHMLQQIIGVGMGSKAGHILAWAVCMVHENASPVADYPLHTHVKRYFDACGNEWYFQQAGGIVVGHAGPESAV